MTPDNLTQLHSSTRVDERPDLPIRIECTIYKYSKVLELLLTVMESNLKVTSRKTTARESTLSGIEEELLSTREPTTEWTTLLEWILLRLIVWIVATVE